MSDASPLVLVGAGVPSGYASKSHHGPGLRLTHFATACVRSGIPCTLFSIVPDALRADLPARGVLEVEGTELPLFFLSEAEAMDPAGPLARTDARGFVGVTVLAAAAVARACGDTPMWADVFGDLMAEAQAKASVVESDASLARFWGLLSAALERADRFSAVSKAQADALIGQLGLAGRLGRATIGEPMVSVVPCAAEPYAERRSGGEPANEPVGLSDVPADAVVVLLSGGFNTWCDIDTLARGFADASARNDKLHLLVTGGALAGHDEETFARFKGRVGSELDEDRVSVLGWIDESGLPAVYRRADIALNVEKPVYERRLGSENRVAHWLANGLCVLSTALSDSGGAAAAAGALEPTAAGDASELGRHLLELADDPERRAQLGARARAYAEQSLGYERTASPLIAWARAPGRAGDAGRARVVRMGLVSEPRTMIAMLEAYLDELSLPQAAYRAARWLFRRVFRR